MNKILLGVVIVVVAFISIGFAVVDFSRNDATLIGGSVGSKVKDNELQVSEDQFTGRWRSLDDSDYEVVKEADGTLVEYYNGEELSNGSWELLSVLPEGEETPSSAEVFDGSYLKKVLNGETIYYGVLVIEENILSVIYFDRGDTLNFERVTEL